METPFTSNITCVYYVRCNNFQAAFTILLENIWPRPKWWEVLFLTHDLPKKNRHAGGGTAASSSKELLQWSSNARAQVSWQADDGNAPIVMGSFYMPDDV